MPVRTDSLLGTPPPLYKTPPDLPSVSAGYQGRRFIPADFYDGNALSLIAGLGKAKQANLELEIARRKALQQEALQKLQLQRQYWADQWAQQKNQLAIQKDRAALEALPEKLALDKLKAVAALQKLRNQQTAQSKPKIDSRRTFVVELEDGKAVQAYPVLRDGLLAGYVTVTGERIDPAKVTNAYQAPNVRNAKPTDYVVTRKDGTKTFVTAKRDPATGKWLLYGDGMEGVPLEEAAKRYREVRQATADDKSRLNIDLMDYDQKYIKPAQEKEAALASMIKFRALLDTLPGGAEGFIERIKGSLKGLAGMDLSPEEKQQKLASAMLNALLGQNREAIVGPGVMTEQDALRVISALGGDVESIFYSPDAAKTAVDMMIKTTADQYNKLIDRANTLRQYNQDLPEAAYASHGGRLAGVSDWSKVEHGMTELARLGKLDEYLAKEHPVADFIQGKEVQASSAEKPGSEKTGETPSKRRPSGSRRKQRREAASLLKQADAIVGM